MAELYAQKLDISDDRIKTMSIAEATFTNKAYTESAVYFPSDPGAVSGGIKTSLDAAKKQGSITEQQFAQSPSSLDEMTATEYLNRKEESQVIKDGAGSANDKAAGEILEKISDNRYLEKSSSLKYYAKNYLEHLVRAVKMQLRTRDTNLTMEKEKELDRRTSAVKELNASFIIKYSKTETFADRVRKISASASKELSAPFEQNKNFKYEGL